MHFHFSTLNEIVEFVFKTVALLRLLKQVERGILSPIEMCSNNFFMVAVFREHFFVHNKNSFCVLQKTYPLAK